MVKDLGTTAEGAIPPRSIGEPGSVQMARSPVQVLLSCHVESGTVRNRTIVFDRRREEGITEALPRIVSFAESAGIPVALHLTAQALRLTEVDLAGFPVGLHLHPRDDDLSARVRGTVGVDSDCLAHYSAADQGKLVAAGCDAFTEAQGRNPTLFVAGNWSENDDTLRLLEAAGIRYDGSALPGHVSACDDWGRLPRLAQPYRPSREDHQIPGDSSIICVPVFQGFWGDYLTPEDLHDLGVRYFMAALKEAAVGGARVVHIYFHSPMALEPFFLQEFRAVVDFARDHIGAEFVPPEAITAEWRPAARPFPPAYFAYLDTTFLKRLFVRRFRGFQPRPRKITGRS